MNRILLLACCGMVLFSGLVHGLWTDRWGSSQQLDEALARVSLVPAKVGEWEAEELEVDAQVYTQAGAKKYWMRRYHHEPTGAEIAVILMCGRAGQMAVHTPDVCYKGAGYEQIGQAKKLSVSLGDLPPAEFWTGNFAKDQAVAPGSLRLYWTWGTRGQWQAPDYPRFTFRGQPFLYKLYVLRQELPATEAGAPDPAIAFLEELLPQMGKSLFPESTP